MRIENSLTTLGGGSNFIYVLNNDFINAPKKELGEMRNDIGSIKVTRYDLKAIKNNLDLLNKVHGFVKEGLLGQEGVNGTLKFRSDMVAKLTGIEEGEGAIEEGQRSKQKFSIINHADIESQVDVPDVEIEAEERDVEAISSDTYQAAQEALHHITNFLVKNLQKNDQKEGHKESQHPQAHPFTMIESTSAPRPNPVARKKAEEAQKRRDAAKDNDEKSLVRTKTEREHQVTYGKKQRAEEKKRKHEKIEEKFNQQEIQHSDNQTIENESIKRQRTK